MKFTRLFLAPALVAATCLLSASQAEAQTDVIAFWDFGAPYEFDDALTKLDFAAAVNGVGNVGVDNTVSGDANLQAFLGDAAELDNNGGGGFTSYTSPVSGISYGTTRTVKWDDLSVSNADFPDFDINGQTEFNVSTGGDPAELDDFGEDALLYLTLDGTGFQDLQIRFDLEGTPGEPDDPTLPNEFDIFYRTTGPNGTWFRPDELNNIEVTFADADPANPDPENQVASTGFISLTSALDSQSQIEIIINDFDNNGNDELEIDNVEIVGNAVAVPEPGSAGLLVMASMSLLGLRRRNR